MEGLVKLLRRKMSGGRMVDVWWTYGRRRTFGGVVNRSQGTQLKQALSRTGV